ncbi:MAG: D-glycero-beta-D-manno-heptose 1-phosphate adenylyltransferase [Pirellulales bacterium]|nr:D-glycero-beta-D-manno-heptose 1-phosphate adenylyltransferase [Pirellulales bacterium]
MAKKCEATTRRLVERKHDNRETDKTTSSSPDHVRSLTTSPTTARGAVFGKSLTTLFQARRPTMSEILPGELRHSEETLSYRLRVHPPSRHVEPAVPVRSHRASHKLVTVKELDARLAPLRQEGACIVLTNGCFDLLHPGHVASLQEARTLGDCLVVGLNSDRSVRLLKGPARPIVDEEGRAAMLTALECVDYVVLFDDAEVARLVQRVRPDVLVKSAEYALDRVVGREIVERYGGRVELVPMKSGYSTTRLVERITAAVAAEAETRKV